MDGDSPLGHGVMLIGNLLPTYGVFPLALQGSQRNFTELLNNIGKQAR